MSTSAELDKRRRVAEDAVRAAAEVHLRYRRAGIEYAIKNDNRRDLVTIADTEAQTAARNVIAAAFPGETVIGEEDAPDRAWMAEALGGRAWVIDPLDGTFYFVHGFPDFSATVAFVDQRRALVGATYAPLLNELFSAASGAGATLNAAPMRVSPRRGLQDAIVSFYAGNVDEALQAEQAALVRAHSFSQRTFGGTAIGLAYVACGRFDVFYSGDNPGLGPWDIAAGAILIEEAGGVVRLANGDPFVLPTTNLAAAADPETLHQLQALLVG